MSDPIPTRESLAGFIATEPVLGTTRTGDARWYVRVGVEHWTKDRGGVFTELAPSFHDMAAYGPLAVRLEGRFHKGDTFVAHGATRAYPAARGGDEVALEFVVRRIGHDIARTRYTVGRGPTANHPASRESASRSVAQGDEIAEVPESGSRLRAVPDPPVEPSSVRPAGGVGADLSLGR